MTGKEASMNKVKETEWLIEHILPKEFNSCLAGTTGAKKSMWAIQWISSLMRFTPWSSRTLLRTKNPILRVRI